ncbi:hypothetical protein ACFV14_26640 [Streptomyces zaomyceticus]|uniref:hypothetical protein n=1 Tax=Streptomyces zaomyceticus TaxID=68286 RepID=UPI0036D07C2A
MTTAHDPMPPDATRVRSAERPVDTARGAAARGAGTPPGCGAGEEPAGRPADRRVDVGGVGGVGAVGAVAQGMPSP